MLDRQDIDALLVGALYGELTPAESERLAHHLDSHPADKASLEDMTRARKAVQDSRILATMAEPPQAISALLLQEAHRRAPRPAPAREVSEGWFARFLKSFVSHPAMAAAAMLVLVVGTAGIIKMRHGSIGADETVSSAPSAPSTAAAPTPARTATFDNEAAQAPATGEGQTRGDLGVAAAGSGMSANLDDGALDRRQELAQGEAAKPLAEPAVVATAKAPSGATNATPSVGITVHTHQPTVKELPEDQEAVSPDVPAEQAPNNKKSSRDFAAPPPRAPVATHASAGGGGAASDRANGVAGDDVTTTGTNAPAQPQAPATSTTTTPAAPPPPPSQTPPPQQDKQKAASDASLVEWAKKQHAQLVQLVQKKDCEQAASVALTIEGRAPDYYAQNIANDRAVAGCMSYVSQERARRADDAAKKSQRVNATDSKK